MELIRDKYLNGDVYKISIRDIDKFFEDNYPFKMSRSGIESFLKSLKIPVNYFIKQPFDTQMELLQNQKELFTSQDKEMTFLKRGDIVEFVNIIDAKYFNELGDRTPVSNDWIFIEEDMKSGYIRYFMTTDTVRNDEYMLGVFIDFPILFSKPMVVNIGFYKVDSKASENNSEIFVPNTKIKLKDGSLPETDHNSYFMDLIDNAKKSNLSGMIKYLENINVDSDSCITLLLSFEKEKMINKSLSGKIRKFIDKEDVILTNMRELVELGNLFIPNIKSYSSKLKFKQDISSGILLRYNKTLDVDFTHDFLEGY